MLTSHIFHSCPYNILTVDIQRLVRFINFKGTLFCLQFCQTFPIYNCTNIMFNVHRVILWPNSLHNPHKSIFFGFQHLFFLNVVQQSFFLLSDSLFGVFDKSFKTVILSLSIGVNMFLKLFAYFVNRSKVKLLPSLEFITSFFPVVYQ